MQLARSVVLTLSDGTTLTIDELSPMLIDNVGQKIVLGRLHPVMKPIVLWRGYSYAEIGDWTQAQAEERILQLLGDNQQETLQSLVVA